MMVMYFTMIQCQRLSNHQLSLSNSNREFLTDGWMIDEDDGNCDVVDEAPWGPYFFRGMIAGLLIGLCGGVLLGFLCWHVQVHKEEGYDLQLSGSN